MKNSQEAIKKKIEDHRKQQERQAYKHHKNTIPNRKIFIKSPEEAEAVKKEKRKHNQFFHETFGTKRPTAGIVRRFFNSY